MLNNINLRRQILECKGCTEQNLTKSKFVCMLSWLNTIVCSFIIFRQCAASIYRNVCPAGIRITKTCLRLSLLSKPLLRTGRRLFLQYKCTQYSLPVHEYMYNCTKHSVYASLGKAKGVRTSY